MKDPLEEAGEGVTRRGATFILFAIVAGIATLAIFKPGSRDALAIVAGLIIMVMLHEAGHYFAARRAGMKATEFFLGFGPRLWSFKRGETEYGVKAILAGGYVRIVGMTNLEQPQWDEEKQDWVHGYTPDDEPRTFRRGSFKNRFIVVLAGVTVNFVLAFVLIFVAFAGEGEVPDGPSTSIHRVVKYETKANGDFLRDENGSKVETAAFAAGLETRDRIVAVDGERVRGWEELKRAIESHGGEETTFTVVRRGERLNIDATPREQDGQGFLGIQPGEKIRDIGVLDSFGETFDAMGDATIGTFKALGGVFTPEGIERQAKNVTSTPKAGTPAARQRLCSIICLVDEGSAVVSGDPWALLRLLGLVSLLLAVFNTLPLLPFDGGHAAVIGYEWIASKVKRRRVTVDYRKLMPVTAVVLAIFVTLALSTMLGDIRRLGS